MRKILLLMIMIFTFSGCDNISYDNISYGLVNKKDGKNYLDQKSIDEVCTDRGVLYYATSFDRSASLSPVFERNGSLVECNINRKEK